MELNLFKQEMECWYYCATRSR